MTGRFAQLWRRLRTLKVPPLRIAILLSLLLHGALLVEWHLRPPPDQKPESKWGDTPGQFTVQLAPLPANPSPPPSTPAPAAIAAQPSAESKPPPKPAPKPPAKPSRATPPPVIALNQPAPAESRPAPAPAAPAATPENDLSAMIEARRRARAASRSSAPAADAPSTPAEDDIARRDRIVAANLGAKTEAFGFDPRNGGGLFQIKRIGLDDAEFMFYGWHEGMRRKAAQVVEVRKGNNADMRIAVVRRMIAIIREHETGNFSWQSQRLGRSLILSAALADSAGLEEFLMAEFFGDGRARR